jgi:hypothetical protein
MKPATEAGFIFIVVGVTGQLSNQFIKDLLALNALLGMIVEI